MSELTQIQKDWLAALRSGDYKQGRYYLKIIEGGQECYCCLGLATHMINPDADELALMDIYEYQVSRGRQLKRATMQKLNIKYNNGRIFCISRTFDNLIFRDEIKRLEFIQRFKNCPYVSLTMLNDEKIMTFPEIADFIEDNAKYIFTNINEEYSENES